MCDRSGKLVAWLDHELSDDEMAQVARHLEGCRDCRRQLHKYEQVSKSFSAYCQAMQDAASKMAKARRRGTRWLVPLLSGAAAAVLVALALFALQTRVEPLGPRVQLGAQPVRFPAPAPELPPAPGKPMEAHRRRVAPLARMAPADFLPAEPTIEVAIPAESMFPPGAIPEGVSFAADVSFAPDGSALQVRLRPRLIGFERSTSQP